MTDREPNRLLAAALAEAKFSASGFARRICDAAESAGVPVHTSHTQIGRWLDGQQPRGAAPQLIATVLSEKLGRTITSADLGFDSHNTPAPDALRMVTDPVEALRVTAELWRADADGTAARHGADLIGPVLGWLTAEPVGSVARDGVQRVGMADVDALRSTLSTFVYLDNEYGGGRARDAAVRYLADCVSPLLDGTFSDAVGRALFTAAAEFTLLTGWMAYDTGKPDTAGNCFVHALALAQAAGDRALGASVLSAMSHQANYIGDPRTALVIARGAVGSVPSDGSSTLRAQFHAMEARAAAGLGDRSACQRALSRSEMALSRTDPKMPPWIAYFDPCEFTDEAAHCHRDLGDHTQAVAAAETCLAFREQGSPRSRVFSRIVYAEALFGVGEAEHGADVANEVLPHATALASRRTAAYLQRLRAKAAPHSSVAAVADFLEKSASDR
ncbi:hypothetical protein ABIA31_002048 [Catenulispora sp. MAP5-51]|uniref:regulator n=1 Tax=Catenulispora sp. MAP5-51 TaxID=3156298 RepID=UPI003519C99E